MWDGKENGGGHFRKNRYANAEHPETILVCWWPMQGWKDTLSLDCEMLGQWGRQSPEQCIPKPDFPIKWSNLKLNMQCVLLPMDAREYLQVWLNQEIEVCNLGQIAQLITMISHVHIDRFTRD